MGIWIGTGLTCSLSFIWATTLLGFAPVRSHLLMKASRGTLYRFIWRSTVRLWLCTPPTLHSTRIAPSSTRKDRSTSTGEVDVAGGVDDVDRVAVPADAGGGRGDRDALFLLEFHVVHGRAAVAALDVAHLVDAAAVAEDALGEGRLARVDVGADADVAVLGEVQEHGFADVRRAVEGATAGRPETGGVAGDAPESRRPPKGGRLRKTPSVRKTDGSGRLGSAAGLTGRARAGPARPRGPQGTPSAHVPERAT